MAYWVNNLDPVIWHIGGALAIRYYGVAYVLAFWCSWILLRRLNRDGAALGIKDEGAESALLLAFFLGAVAGGRIGYFVFYDFQGWLRDPLSVFRVWEGGMSSHGGFVGAIAGAGWVSATRRIGFWRVTDTLCVLTPPGFFLGRIANFVNGELWGKIAHVPWAVIFPASAVPGTPTDQIPPRHPSQLYEALLEGVILFVWARWRFGRTRGEKPGPGALSGEFLMVYAVLRIVSEMFRAPDAPLILGLSRGVFYSLWMILAGFLIRFVMRGHRR
ncbi:MAG: prolipoprotein diacylglyceryl transferase [Candidatus Omnitrophica bacterium]|nr:prolipoprotein diacylglyceryl transferase [Candidatus Omnitrophota bacterium]